MLCGVKLALSGQVVLTFGRVARAAEVHLRGKKPNSCCCSVYWGHVGGRLCALRKRELKNIIIIPGKHPQIPRAAQTKVEKELRPSNSSGDHKINRVLLNS